MTNFDAHMATIMIIGIIAGVLGGIIVVCVVFGPLGLLTLCGLSLLVVMYAGIYESFKRMK